MEAPLGVMEAHPSRRCGGSCHLDAVEALLQAVEALLQAAEALLKAAEAHSGALKVHFGSAEAHLELRSLILKS
jgi:hypothetical protein